MRFHIIIKIIILIFCLNAKSFAQDIATPLVPEEMPTQREIGGIFTFGQNYQSGNFKSPCNCPEFSDGVKFGYSFGPTYMQDLTRTLQWGGAILLDFRGFKSTYQIWEQLQATSEATGRTETANVLFRQSADVNLTYLGIQPFLNYSPSPYFFIRLGATASFLLSSKLNHTKELLTNSVRFSNGEVVTVKLADSKTNVQEIYNGEFPDASSFIFDLNPMIGFNMKLGENIFLSPGFIYVIPLTSVSTVESDLKSNTWRLFLEFRIALTMRDKRN